MLILTRTRGSEIVIGNGADRIIVRIVDVDRGKVRVGIEAPRSVPIIRSELLSESEKAEVERVARGE